MKNFNVVNAVVTSVMLIAAGSCGSRQNTPSYPEPMYEDYVVNTDFDSELELDSTEAVFSLWSPKAEAVTLRIYDSWDADTASVIEQMNFDAKNGTWSVAVEGAPSDFYGKYYTFQVQTPDSALAETPGIWAKAVGVNGKRAAIIDFAETNPEGWEDDKSPDVKNQTDAIVYEMHLRDFSMDENSGMKNHGKFLALTEKGTKSAQGVATGIDHLKELGITHVHILPSYDYSSIDETNLSANGYNWGYDPQNYNAPEGSYSTNPYDPVTRVKEMKQMVKSLHDSGIGVIMDVVYNHTAVNDESNFSLTAPGYFYRHNADGSYSDASGCGNETASDREMMRRFIINSVKYWMQEYHIDGFRFDLMGIHDLETMNQLASELREINPNVIFYGEGWTAGASPLEADKRALKDNAYLMPGNAVFSDDIRDAIKGHYSRAEERGFATGAEGNEETVKFGIVAATKHPQIDFDSCNNSKAPYANSPLQVVNYVSCHDDLTLTDKLRKSMPEATDAERQKAAKLAQTIVFTSQGMPFMFAGEEMFRDKKGVHNSYCSPDSINTIDWSLKSTNADLFDYYKELIALRKAHPAFRMTTTEDVAQNLVFDDTANEPLLISYSIINNANGDEWNEIKLIFNGSDKSRTVSVPENDWIIVAQDGKIDSEGIGYFKGGNVEVAPRSATILARK